jgi:hypothetical protein
VFHRWSGPLFTVLTWSLTNLLHSEFREEIYEGGKKKAIWRSITKNRPNHDWDLCGIAHDFHGHRRHRWGAESVPTDYMLPI